MTMDSTVLFFLSDILHQPSSFKQVPPCCIYPWSQCNGVTASLMHATTSVHCTFDKIRNKHIVNEATLTLPTCAEIENN